jgi:hypothetical protein
MKSTIFICTRAAALAVLLSLSWICRADVGAALVGDETVLASAELPQTGLSCSEAAAQTRLSFKALKLPFQPRRVALFVNGQGVPTEGVQQNWPEVRLSQGLQPGRNVVELVLYGDKDQAVERRQVVLLGTQAADDDVDPVQISCVDDVAAQAAPPADPAQNETTIAVPPPEGYDDQAFVDERPVYVDHYYYVPGPAYYYAPWPVFGGAGFFWGAYCPPPAFVYRPAPPAAYWPRYSYPSGNWQRPPGSPPPPGNWQRPPYQAYSSDRHPIPLPAPNVPGHAGPGAGAEGYWRHQTSTVPAPGARKYPVVRGATPEAPRMMPVHEFRSPPSAYHSAPMPATPRAPAPVMHAAPRAATPAHGLARGGGRLR